MIIHDYDDNAALGPDGLVKPGHGIRVPMSARDSAAQTQHERRSHNRQIEDYGVVHGGNSARPGFIVAADSSMYDAAEAARRQWIVDLQCMAL